MKLTRWRNLKPDIEGKVFLGRTKAFAGLSGFPQKTLDILVFNVAGSVMYRYDPWEFQLDSGYSSGEKRSFGDGEINSIPFDPDFNVGLIV